MILLSRLNGSVFALNPDLFERVEANPDTVVTLCDGTRYVVAESVAQVVELVRQWRAEIVSSARDLGFAEAQPALAPVAAVGRHVSVVPSEGSYAGGSSEDDLTRPVVPLRRRRRS